MKSKKEYIEKNTLKRALIDCLEPEFKGQMMIIPIDSFLEMILKIVDVQLVYGALSQNEVNYEEV